MSFEKREKIAEQTAATMVFVLDDRVDVSEHGWDSDEVRQILRTYIGAALIQYAEVLVKGMFDEVHSG